MVVNDCIMVVITVIVFIVSIFRNLRWNQHQNGTLDILASIYWGNKGSNYHVGALLPLVFKTTNGTRTSNSLVRSLALKCILLVMICFAWFLWPENTRAASLPLNLSSQLIPALLCNENLHLFMNHPQKTTHKVYKAPAQISPNIQQLQSHAIQLPTQPEEWY